MKNEMYDIKNGAPIPQHPRWGGLSGKLRTTISKMKVGEYFDLSDPADSDVARLAYRMAVQMNRKVRTQKQNGGPIRVWRIK